MADRGQIYRCDLCGNIVEVLSGGKGQLVCCGQPMKLLAENTADAAKEKHVPVIEKIENGWRVKVGSVAHPMEDKHYIEWIALYAEDRVYRKYLKPGDPPQADFFCPAGAVAAKEHCNLHGLWSAKN